MRGANDLVAPKPRIANVHHRSRMPLVATTRSRRVVRIRPRMRTTRMQMHFPRSRYARRDEEHEAPPPRPRVPDAARRLRLVHLRPHRRAVPRERAPEHGAEGRGLRTHGQVGALGAGLAGKDQPDVGALLREHCKDSVGVSDFRVSMGASFHDWLLTHLTLGFVRMKTVRVTGKKLTR